MSAHGPTTPPPIPPTPAAAPAPTPAQKKKSARRGLFWKIMGGLGILTPMLGNGLSALWQMAKGEFAHKAMEKGFEKLTHPPEPDQAGEILQKLGLSEPATGPTARRKLARQISLREKGAERSYNGKPYSQQDYVDILNWLTHHGKEALKKESGIDYPTFLKWLTEILNEPDQEFDALVLPPKSEWEIKMRGNTAGALSQINKLREMWGLERMGEN